MTNPAAVIEYAAGFSGLSITLDLYPDGSDTVAASGIVLTEATHRKGVYTGTTTAGLTGWYRVQVHVGGNEIPDGFVFMTSDTSTHLVGPSKDADQQAILDAIEQLQLVTTIEVTSPVLPGGEVQVVLGDDYLDADGRALEWASGGTWPDLTGADIELTVTNPLARGAVVIDSAAGSVIASTGEDQAVQVELTADQTEGLKPGTLSYSVRATLASGHVVTLVSGELQFHLILPEG